MSDVRDMIGRRAKLCVGELIQCLLLPSYFNRSWNGSTNLMTSAHPLSIFHVNALAGFECFDAVGHADIVNVVGIFVQLLIANVPKNKVLRIHTNNCLVVEGR